MTTTFERPPPARFARSISALPFRQRAKPPAVKPERLTRQEIEDCYSRITCPLARARFRNTFAKELKITTKGAKR